MATDLLDVEYWRSCIPRWKLAGYRLACGHLVWINTQFQATGDDWLYCALSRLWLRARCEIPARGTWGHFECREGVAVERPVMERLAA